MLKLQKKVSTEIFISLYKEEMIMKTINTTYLLDSDAAHKNFFYDERMAFNFIKDQLVRARDTLNRNRDLFWSGHECSVSGTEICSLLKMFERDGISDSVAIYPVVYRSGRSIECRYIILPFLCAPNANIKVGIAISGDM